MTGQRWTIKEAAEALGLSEKTVRRRIKDGSLKAEQTKGKYGVEYRITSLDDAPSPDGGLDTDRGIDIEKSLVTEKDLDIEGDTMLAKALDIIKALQEENARLTGQFSILQSQVLELDSRVRLLTEPKHGRSWWQGLLWWRNTPET
ncbi:helix-turn-helix domain-containing protein [Chloroflexota bacterium]